MAFGRILLDMRLHKEKDRCGNMASNNLSVTFAPRLICKSFAVAKKCSFKYHAETVQP